MNNYQTGFNPYYNPSGLYSPQFQPSYQQNQFQGSQGVQNRPQPMFQQQTMDTPIQGVKFVTEDEAKAFIVMPNTKVMLMDRNNSVFYIKSADTLGQSTLETYEFSRLDPNAKNSKEEQKTEEPKVDLEVFVKKDQLGDFVTLSDLDDFKHEMYMKLDEITRRRDNNQNRREGGNNNGKSTR